MCGSKANAVAIIPAFNEEGRVGAVVKTALQCNLFNQIIVVDDGSEDSTSEHARKAGAQVIRLEPNKGKPVAMLAGMQASSEEVLCFLDADLLNISSDQINDLVAPVLSGSHDCSLAVFSGGRAATTLAQRISPMISGQRCIRRKLLEGFDGWDSGFGIETAINAFLKKGSIEQRIVRWEGASHVMKEEKRGFWAGLMERIRMYYDILRTWIKTKRVK